MKKTLLVLALVVAAPLANASESNGIGYSNVQLDYINEYEVMDGVGISGALEVSDNVFVTGSYAQTENSNDWMGLASDTKHKSWTLGVGFNTAIGTRADWVSQLAFARHDFSDRHTTCSPTRNSCSVYSWSDHARGYNLSTGVRGRITDKLTANAYLGYEDYRGGYDGNWYADLNAGYNFTPTWSLESGVRLDGGETWKLGVRASF